MDASDDSKIRVSGSKSTVKQMHPLTLTIELTDVSTNSKNGVSDCIHSLKDYKSRQMHPPNLKYNWWMHEQIKKLESTDASTN